MSSFIGNFPYALALLQNRTDTSGSGRYRYIVANLGVTFYFLGALCRPSRTRDLHTHAKRKVLSAFLVLSGPLTICPAGPSLFIRRLARECAKTFANVPTFDLAGQHLLTRLLFSACLNQWGIWKVSASFLPLVS